jgi:autotransporter-associated beta strand protein
MHKWQRLDVSIHLACCRAQQQPEIKTKADTDMKLYKTYPATSVCRNRYLNQIPARCLVAGKAWGLLMLVLAAWLWCAPNAAGVAPTNTWLGAGSDIFWNTTANWDAAGVPVPTSLVILTNSGATGLPGTNGLGALGTPNITITNDTTVGQLWIVNSNYNNLLASYHTIGINPGVTLTVTNNATNLVGSANIMQVMSSGGYFAAFGGNGVSGNTDPNYMIYATLQGGAGSTFNLNCTNGVTAWNHGNLTVEEGALNGGSYTEPCNATLDLSGLDNFNAAINHLCVGADGAPGIYYFHRPRGTLYLARTNTIVLLATGTFPSENATHGIWEGLMAQNNGAGTNHQGSILLGRTNGIYCDTGIGLGLRGVSGFIGFNTNNPPGSSVYFRDRTTGTGRQSLWALGDRTGTAANNNQDVRGEMDFSLGSVDAMVGTLRMGVSTVTGNRSMGLLEFGAGVIDVNTLLLGVQSTSGMGPAQGTITVSNTAVLRVNTSGQIGTIAGSPVAGSYFGQILIANGGTVVFSNTAPITCGSGESDLYVDNASSLSVFTVGTAAAPLTNLRLSGSTLTVDRGTASNPTTGGLIFVNNLDLSGVNTINMLGPVLVKGQFAIIKYASIINGGFANLTLGSVSPGVVGHLFNNVANSSIDFVVTSSTTSVLTWDGQTNGTPVGIWDINVTPDWQGAQKYTQTSVPGSLVRFDDTATGTTIVSITNLDVAPASLFISNSSKAYTLNGTNAIGGPTALIKDGPGSLTLANTKANTFSGGVFLNNGILNNGGNGNILPTSATVTIQDVATAGINLNDLPLSMAVLSGAGSTGGNINLGAGVLTVSGGGGTYGGVISGTGRLNKTGSGTQTLTGANTYSGGTYVTNAGLVVLANNGLGTGPILISTNGVVQLGNGTLDAFVSQPSITNYNGTLTLYPSVDFTFTNVVAGSGILAKGAGNGTTVYITNANPYTGQTLIQQGALQINHPLALGTNIITVGGLIGPGASTELALSGNITLTNPIALSAKTGGVSPSPVGIDNVPDIVTGLPGTNTLLGTITLNGSTFWSVGSDVGKLIVKGNVVNNQGGASCVLWLRGAAEGVWASALKDLSAAAILNIMKNDSGTWTLSGTNTYTGTTQITEGTLKVDGAILSTNWLRVFGGATLAGSGVIRGSVTNEGTLSPGGDGVIGTLTISNALFSDAGTYLNFDVSPAGNDSIRGITTYRAGGSLTVNLLAPITGNCIFKLFDAAMYDPSTTYDVVTLPDITPFGWDTSYLAVDGTLHVTNGPASTPSITSITTGSGGAITIGGTGTLVAPFTVLTTTNLATPLTNWQVIGTGTFTNGTFNFTDTSATNSPRRFYRVMTLLP